MMKHELCPFCGEGHLNEKIIYIEREHNGKKGPVALHMSNCEECGCDITSNEQSIINKRLITSFKKECDNYETSEKIKSLRHMFGITQKEAALIFGGGPTSFSKYENNDICQTEAMDKLLKISSVFPQTFFYLAKQAGVEIKCENEPVAQLHFLKQAIWHSMNNNMNVEVGSSTSRKDANLTISKKATFSFSQRNRDFFGLDGA